MNDRDHRRTPSDAAPDPQEALPGRVIAVILGALALALVGGYFFVMKLVEMGRNEDCLMSGRRDCAGIEFPVKR